MNNGIAKGVLFDNIHSFHDLNLIFAGAEIPPATPKENYIDVPGADSSLDLTEALGEVKYNDRSGCKFTFTMNPDGDLSDEAFEAKKTEISNLLNGTVRKITLDKDPDYYYLGRCTVNGYAQNKKIKQFVISAKVKPYKYKQNETEVIVCFCGKNLFNTSVIPLDAESNTNTYISAVNAGSITITSKSGYSGNGYKYLGVTLKQLCPQIVSGQKYTINANSPAANKGLYLVDAKTSWLFGKSIILTEDMVNSDVGLYGFHSTVDGYGDCVISNIQIEIGEVVTDYEPYQTITPQDVILSNSRKTVVPIINCTNKTKITFNDNEYSLNAGTHKILDLQLYEGDNPITVDGSGAVTFTYQEGAL